MWIIWFIAITCFKILQNRNTFLLSGIFSYYLWTEGQRNSCDQMWHDPWTVAIWICMWLMGDDHIKQQTGMIDYFYHVCLFISLLSCRGWTSLRLSTKPLFHSLVNVCSFSADCCSDRCGVCWSLLRFIFPRAVMCNSHCVV